MWVDAPAEITVTGFDHLVLNVADAERSLAWYCGLLGLEAVRVDEWRRGAAPFPSVRIDATTIIDLLARQNLSAADDGVRNLDHLCFVVEAGDVDAILTDARFDVVDGPGTRFGAQGNGWSVYVQDPDGNRVEFRSY